MTQLDVRYLGASGLRDGALAFAPNLARAPVFFDGELRHPLRFREAMSALHAVVVGDLRRKKKDRTTWLAWKEQQAQDEAKLRRELLDRARVDAVRELQRQSPPPNLDADFRAQHRIYWDARVRWANELAANDPALFRALVPCDPVVTVAPDVVFFECFAKDESAYGCLTVDRNAFGHDAGGAAGLGTTNVDYSLALYEHFQTLRSYRSTRLLVDPSGFEVATASGAGGSNLREEKIDLPPSWLRGFGQLQAAMALPSTRFELSVDAVYSVLAWLARHREKQGPRSLRVRLVVGRAPVLVLDPWGVEIPSRGAVYDGPPIEGDEIKLWGRRRLDALARILPLAERFTVTVFGSGMPSIWVARMGEMSFVLALSGWTANDWTRGSNLDTFFSGFEASLDAADGLARYLEVARHASLVELERQVALPRKQVLGGLHALAKRGQLAYDFTADVYRWRPILPVALSEALLGPENPELVAAREMVAARSVVLARDESLPGGRRLLVGKVGDTSVEGIMDLDGAFRGAKCTCSYFYRFRLRAGPCRHLLALRTLATQRREASAPAPELSAAKGMLVHLPEAILLALGEEAARRRESLHVVAVQAWKLARKRITTATSLAELSVVEGPYREAARTPQVLQLPREVEAEIQREAARLDVGVSRILEAAWRLAEPTLRNTTSILR